MNKNSRYLFILIAVVAVFASCRSGKKIKGAPSVQDTSEYVVIDTVVEEQQSEKPFIKPVIGEGKQAMIASAMPIWEKRMQYATFSGKAKMHYEGDGQKQDFVANFRIIKDSAMWVSVSALGGMVNVARALVRPDSIFLISYLQKTAYAMSANQAGSLLPVQMDYSILQNLIMGEVLSHDGMVVDVADFGSTINLHVMDARTIQQIKYSKVDSALRTLQMITNNGQGSVAAFLQYGTYEKVQARDFAMRRAININNNGALIYLDMNYSNIEFDEEMRLPFKIPSTYTLNPPSR